MNYKTILVVEDDAAIRRGLADALDFAGYDTREAGNGKKGRAGQYIGCQAYFNVYDSIGDVHFFHLKQRTRDDFKISSW